MHAVSVSGLWAKIHQILGDYGTIRNIFSSVSNVFRSVPLSRDVVLKPPDNMQFWGLMFLPRNFGRPFLNQEPVVKFG